MTTTIHVASLTPAVREFIENHPEGHAAILEAIQSGSDAAAKRTAELMKLKRAYRRHEPTVRLIDFAILEDPTITVAMVKSSLGMSQRGAV